MPNDGLEEQSVSVPILSLNEKAPSKAGPFGRLTKAINVIVNKFSEDGKIQVDKRPGFHSLPVDLYDPYGGSAPPGTLPEAAVAGKLGKVNFIVGQDGTPYIYSPANEAWAKFSNETIVANRISTAPVKLDTSAIKNNDTACIGSTVCHVWTDQASGNGYAEFVDEDGSFIRSPFVAASKTGSLASGVRIKVVADEEASVFWIVTDNASISITAMAFGQADGQQIGSGVLAHNMYQVGCFWDAIHDADVASGVCIVATGSAATSTNGITIANIAMVSGTPSFVSGNSSNAFSADVFNGVSFLKAAHDGNLYVAYVNAPTAFGFYLSVGKTTAACSLAHEYNLVQGPFLNSVAITSIGGFVDNLTGNVYGFVGLLPYTGVAPVAADMIKAYTLFGYATPTSDFLQGMQRRSVIPASDVFFAGEVPCIFSCYTSVPTIVEEVDGSVQQGNPTYFVLRADTGLVVGRLLPGQAAGNSVWESWDGTTASPDAFQLPSPRVATDGTTIVPVPSTGSQSISRTRANDGPFVDTFTSSIGIQDVKFSQSYGKCVECENETLIPGALPRSFDGQSFGAAGIELAPEQPVIVDHTGPGPWNIDDVRSYVIVYERLNRFGNKVYSPSSVLLRYSESTGAGRAAELTIPTLRATTHDDVIISVYRSVMTNGQEGLTHYKITSDQSPIFNDPTVDTVTFVDSVDDATAILGQPLYGGAGSIPSSLGGGDGQEVDHECAPAFNTGAVFGDRAFLAAYDNAAWFSLPGQAGVSLAFSAAFRQTVPTQDRVTAIDAVDQHLVIFCSQSIWTSQTSSYLDSTGAGDIPTPFRLPISNGCTGVEYMFKEGGVYASSAGGFYLLTRDLDSQYIGAAIEDDAKGHAVVDIAVDDSQRIYFLIDDSASSLCVFDIISRTWALWQISSTFGAKLTNVGGKLAVCATSGAVKVLAPGSYDDDSSPIISQITIADISVAGLAGCQMIWQVLLMGISYSVHQLFVDYIPDGRTALTEVFGPIDPRDFGVGVGDDYETSIEPEQMETSSFRLEISDAFTSPGRGLSLQQIGLSVGIVPGVRRPTVARTGSPRS